MEFKELQKEMIAAMKSGDKVRKNSISNLIAAIKKVAIDEGKREEIPSELVERVILKELKSAKEQIDTCPDSRADLKEEYTTNYNIISEFATPVSMAGMPITPRVFCTSTARWCRVWTPTTPMHSWSRTPNTMPWCICTPVL